MDYKASTNTAMPMGTNHSLLLCRDLNPYVMLEIIRFLLHILYPSSSHYLFLVLRICLMRLVTILTSEYPCMHEGSPTQQFSVSIKCYGVPFTNGDQTFICVFFFSSRCHFKTLMLSCSLPVLCLFVFFPGN